MVITDNYFQHASNFATVVGLDKASPYMDAPRLQEQSFDDDDTESIAAIHSVSDAAVV
jgi:hypothetical protein